MCKKKANVRINQYRIFGKTVIKQKSFTIETKIINLYLISYSRKIRTIYDIHKLKFYL